MLTTMSQINPIDLLHNPYKPIDKYELAELLGVSVSTVESWIKHKRNPSKTAKILAWLLLSQWRTQQKTT